MATSSTVKSTFFDDLDWTKCNNCMTSLTQQKKFILTTCEDLVLCFECAKKIRSTESPRKLRCPTCKQSVGAIPIDENMPEDKLSLFMTHHEIGNEIAGLIATYENQSHEEVAELKQMDAEIKKYKQELAESLQKLKRSKNLLKDEESTYQEGEYEYYRDMMLNVMSPDRIETLVNLEPEQLNRLNAAQMLEASYRPPPTQTVSSTPYNTDGCNMLDLSVGDTMNMNAAAMDLGQCRQSNSKRPQEISERRNSIDRRRRSREIVDSHYRRGSRECTRRLSKDTSGRRNSNDRRRMSHEMFDGLTRCDFRERDRR